LSTELTFVHRFSRSVCCTVHVQDETPEPESQLILQFEWTERPKPKHIAEYRQWMLGTLQALCDRWQGSILYCFGSGPRTTELWSFEPGKPPRLQETIPVGLP
jgi:hypothetical protein